MERCEAVTLAAVRRWRPKLKEVGLFYPSYFKHVVHPSIHLEPKFGEAEIVDSCYISVGIGIVPFYYVTRHTSRGGFHHPRLVFVQHIYSPRFISSVLLPSLVSLSIQDDTVITVFSATVTKICTHTQTNSIVLMPTDTTQSHMLSLSSLTSEWWSDFSDNVLVAANRQTVLSHWGYRQTV